MTWYKVFCCSNLCYSAKAKSLKGWDNSRPIESQFGVLLRRAGQDTRECQVSHTILSVIFSLTVLSGMCDNRIVILIFIIFPESRLQGQSSSTTSSFELS